MKIYLSGPISGRDLPLAQAAFDEAETMLTREGHEVINPMKVAHREGFSWAQYMVDDLRMLMDCQAIWMMEGWLDSPGARIEFLFAEGAGIQINNLLDGEINKHLQNEQMENNSGILRTSPVAGRDNV